MIKQIVWDWNGTLLNDIDRNIEIINLILEKRNLDRLSREDYRSYFKMPIRLFYDDIGIIFDKESLNDIAKEYVDLYAIRFESCDLFQNAIYVLDELSNRGIKNYILSATNHHDLIEQVQQKNISDYFTKIIGNMNIEGQSKIDRGIELITYENFRKDETLYIGDTLHDYDVASAMGVKCLLNSKGHQLIPPGNNYIIINDLKEIMNYI